MTDKQLMKLLKTYSVPPASKAARTDCIRLAKGAGARAEKKHRASLLKLVRVQFSYMKTSRLLFLFAAVLLVAISLSLLTVFNPTANMQQELFAVNIIVSPLFVLPLVVVLFQNRQSGMIELEAACRYSLQKLVTARLLINGILALFAILIVSIATGFAAKDFAVNRLLFAVISYNISLMSILWFGKRTVWQGIAAVALWILLTLCVLWTPQLRSFLYQVNLWTVLSATVISCIVLLGVVYRYVISITFEREDLKWNLLLTD